MQWSIEKQISDVNEGLRPDERSLKLIAEMGSSILEYLDFTYDTPSQNENHRMPVLDTQIWVGKEARIKGIPSQMTSNSTKVTKLGELKNIILFGFYKKPMANKCGNLKRSGLPEQQKYNTAVQEVLRRLKNTSRELPISEYEVTIIDYMGELAMGGYSHQWRSEVLLSAVKGYARIWELEATGKVFVN